MATDAAQREAAGNGLATIRGGSVLAAGLPAAGLPAAGLPAAGVPGWGVRRRQFTGLAAGGTGQLGAGGVSRAGLVEAARSSGCRLVAVTAPAGYGKSAFLAEWAAAEDRRVVWVSLDRFDDDPAVLVASLASACCRAGLGSAELAAGMNSPSGAAAGRAAARLAVELAAELGASPVPFVLMLDDLHVLRSPACHDVLGVVVSAVPAGSQVATASRSVQPYLPRLRAAGQALELGAGDLALDAAGAQQIFAGAQVRLTAEAAAAVTVRTEGWPAGLYLAAVIAKESRGQAPAITGDDRYVADYLHREALSQQPEDMQRFLRRTAVLDQLCGPLCDAVLGSCDAAGRLRRLEAAGMFVVPLDRRQRWYRYHALFREFLLAELGRTEPAMIAALHQRAADWYEASRSPSHALEHLLHTPSGDRSARLAAAVIGPAYHTGQLTAARRWLAAVGDANTERYPPLAVLAAWIGLLTGDTARAQRWAAFVDAASFDGVPTDGSACFESARAMLRAGLCATGPEQMTADAAFAAAREPAWSPWRADALLLLGEAHLLTGHPGQARAAFTDGAATAAAAHNPTATTICQAQLAHLAMDSGDWQDAATRLDLALATIDENHMHDHVHSIPAYAGAARLSLHHGDLNQASRQLTHAMGALPAATYLLPHHATRLRLQLARVHLALADTATARQLLRDTYDILRHRPALGALTSEVEQFRQRTTAAAVTGRPPLTPAELRLLPYLQTHLTADRIADQLFVSSWTVKTEVKAIYRKLGVSSRNDAVQKAAAIGLLST
jgi:LuxR family maltose regulon positive regulatory protein